ncbi:MAG: TolC family protein [Elusimicrobiota bacterium]|jgi:outer membrane protein|nr:TolC family protein [Elusimicrobiota bacterium]
MIKIKFLRFTLFLVLAAFAAGGRAAAGAIALTLEQCSRDAAAHSPRVKQLRAQALAQKQLYQSAGAAYYPSLYFDAYVGWVSEVPKITLGPLGGMQFGDNWSYSAGPTLEYILFDYGGRSGALDGARSAWQSAEKEAAFVLKTALLDVRRAYLAVQNDLENIYLTAGQLKVAQKQLADVQAAFKAGGKSRLDVTLALKQELRARANISAARGALGSHLRDLFALTGVDYGIDPHYPTDWRVPPDARDTPATAFVRADGLEETLKIFTPFSAFVFDEDIPSLAALEDMAQYYQNLARSLEAGLYPRLALSGGAYLEYPNGPINESVFLGRAGISMRLPLYEASKTRGQSAAQKSMAAAARYQKADLGDSLKNIFFSARGMLGALKDQARLTQGVIAAAQEAAALTYEAYKAGALTFLEVDNANLALLESQIMLADIYIQTLGNMAVLDNLGRADSPLTGDNL